jgi:hypothetical protein
MTVELLEPIAQWRPLIYVSNSINFFFLTASAGFFAPPSSHLKSCAYIMKCSTGGWSTWMSIRVPGPEAG